MKNVTGFKVKCYRFESEMQRAKGGNKGLKDIIQGLIWEYATIIPKTEMLSSNELAVMN